MAFFRCATIKQSGGGGKKQIAFYPFQDNGAIYNYGGFSIDKMKFSAEEVEEIEKVTIRGRVWHSAGSTQSKTTCVGYIFVGEKDGKMCYFNGSNWVVTTTNITTKFDVTPVMLANFTSNNATTITAEINNREIPVGKIVDLADQNGINLDFDFALGSPTVTGISKTMNVEVLGSKCCFEIFRYSYRNRSTTNANCTYGFSVGMGSSEDTLPVIASNPPQVRISWKGNDDRGVFYKDAVSYVKLNQSTANLMSFTKDGIAFPYNPSALYSLDADKVQFGYSKLEIDYFSSVNETVRTVSFNIDDTLVGIYGLFRTFDETLGDVFGVNVYDPSTQTSDVVGVIPFEESEKEETCYIKRIEFKERAEINDGLIYTNGLMLHLLLKFENVAFAYFDNSYIRLANNTAGSYSYLGRVYTDESFSGYSKLEVDFYTGVNQTVRTQVFDINAQANTPLWIDRYKNDTVQIRQQDTSTGTVTTSVLTVDANEKTSVFYITRIELKE